MGYKVETRTAAIDFAEDNPWHGIEARVVISVPFATLLWYQRNAETMDAALGEEAIRQWGEKYLQEWNIEDAQGVPIPATADGAVTVEDNGIVTALMMAWMEAVVHVPSPLSAQYDASPMLVEESIGELAKASTSRAN
jgi:hypothetical protein